MNPAVVGDIEARWRPLTDQQRVNAAAFLDDAWWLLLGRRPGLATDLDEGRVSTYNTIRVLSAMVLRILRNPDGKFEESIDDYRYRRDQLVASGRLHVTDEELADVTPWGVNAGAFTIRPGVVAIRACDAETRLS